MTVASAREVEADLGERAVRFINSLKHTKGEWAGQPFRLRPWQEAEIIRPIFGTLLPDGRRQYRIAYIELPRKNGKTELAAGIGLYLFSADGEPAAEVYSAAVDRDQASLVFGAAAQMVRQSPTLLSEIRIVDSRRNMARPSTNSFYRAIPAEAPGRHGYNAHGIIYDELHAAPNRELWDALTTSTGSRRQPLIVVITTAGYDRHSICWELHDYAVKVRDGVIDDPTFLAVIYAADNEDDWTDEAVWRKANPALGDFRSLDEMRIACQHAQEIPGQQNAFRRLYLNQWTEQDSRWIDMDVWDGNAAGVDAAALLGRSCYAGLDLSSTTDLSALELYFPDEEEDGGTWMHFYFVPEANMEGRARRDRVPYPLWAEQGHIEATPGNVIDYAFIRERLNALVEGGFQIEEVAFDPWNATQLVTELMADGFTCVPIRQGFASLSAPTKEFEKLLLARRFRGLGHPVARWAASNVSVEQDAAGNLKPSKAKSTDRIDPIVAMVMALDRATRHAQEPPPEVFRLRRPW